MYNNTVMESKNVVSKNIESKKMESKKIEDDEDLNEVSDVELDIENIDKDDKIKLNKKKNVYDDEDDVDAGTGEADMEEDAEEDDIDDDDDEDNAYITDDEDDKTTNKSTIDESVIIDNEDKEEEDDDDDDDDEEEENDENYLKKFDKELKNDFLESYHPESYSHNFEEVKMLTNVVRDENNNIVDPLHKTIPFLTKFEKSRILGQRAKQIDSGATPFVKVDKSIIDGYLIALKELEEKKIPFIIKRPLPNGAFEYWNVSDLELVC
jgi:DNA-directed RNA polymerase I, II, and III subunit RPABC2